MNAIAMIAACMIHQPTTVPVPDGTSTGRGNEDNDSGPYLSAERGEITGHVGWGDGEPVLTDAGEML